MIKSTIYWILFFSFLSVRGQESILKLSPGKNYKIYFVYVKFLNTGKEQIDTVKNKFTITWDNDKSFLMDDKAAIDRFQRNWKGKQSTDYYFCWYDYFLYLVEDGKIVDEIRVNEECKTVVCKHGIFDYPKPILESLDKSNVITVAQLRFDSLSIGRSFIKDARANSEIYIPIGEDDEWVKYDGFATINVKGVDDKKIKADIRKKILKKNPNADFMTRLTGGGQGYSVYHIYCNEQLGKNLNDFDVFLNWELMKPSEVMIISNSSNPIKELVRKYGR